MVGAGRLHTLGGAHTAGAGQDRAPALISHRSTSSATRRLLSGVRGTNADSALYRSRTEPPTAGHLLRRVDILREAQPSVAQGVVEVEDLKLGGWAAAV